MNKISDVLELWVEGEVVRTVSSEQLLRDPEAPNKAYKDFFQIE